MSEGTKKPRSVNTIDVTGKQVAANVRRLRGGMTYKELSQKMADVGREITVLGLRRIEAGERKVDVDDLMAFAIVFGVSPLTLLLPEYGSKDVTTRITGYPDEIGTNVIWLWARGDEPLELPQDPHLPDTSLNDREIAIFRLRARPEIDDRETVTAVAAWLPSDAQESAKVEQGMLVEANRRSRAQLIRPKGGTYSLLPIIEEH